MHTMMVGTWLLTQVTVTLKDLEQVEATNMATIAAHPQVAFMGQITITMGLLNMEDKGMVGEVTAHIMEALEVDTVTMEARAMVRLATTNIS